ncbi:MULTISPECIES: heavy-metal-associated domain-containing protein [Arthrobacter]|uniref:Copper chaperone CopZ n=1 Tax=Crystallibacter crystallopoietes TaxID=37928 RepID=A0A1H1FW99_9MICC|nr:MULTISPECIES: cation transporter [Arthrobacter]AUI52900.1 heavy metal transporter [Arthrobacter crystallopoietes]MCW2134221.1 Copper chaperone CopZ [Arthrobacter sp. VKM Ac-2550]SDR04806.1 Copper chaperone CopZ [Arthrobacter crystallopoietes]
METRVGISGMTCNHCIASVTEELMELDGVEIVTIDLNKDGISTASITSGMALDPDKISDAVTEAGYQVVSNNA